MFISRSSRYDKKTFTELFPKAKTTAFVAVVASQRLVVYV